MSGISRLNGNLAFVLPIMPREFGVENMDQPISNTSASPVKVIDPAQSQNSSIDWTLTQEDKEIFTETATYLLSNTLKKSSSKTIKNLGLLVKVAKKVTLKHLHAEEINAEELAKTLAEIVVKNKIQLEVSNGNPYIYIALKLSELTEIFRPALQNALSIQINENLNHLPQGFFARYRDKDIPRLFLHQVYLFSYAALEVSSWAGRLTSYYAGKSVELTYEAGSFVGRTTVDGVGKLGLRLSNFFNEEIAGRTLYSTRRAEIVQEEEVLECDTQAEKEKPKEIETTQGENKRSSATKIPAWPNPFTPHPITKTVGGSIQLSGSSNSRPQFQGQLNLTILGPKNLPGAGRFSNMVGPQDTSTGGPYGNPNGPGRIVVDNSFIMEPIQKARDNFNSCLDGYNAEKDTLGKIQASFSSSDSLDDAIAKSDAAIKSAKSLVQLSKQTMDAAWAVRKLTCKKAVREYGKPYKNSIYHTINTAVKNVLYTEFEVPRLKRLEEKHLSLAGRVKTWQTIESHAGQDKEFLKTHKEYCQKETSIIQIEESDTPIDRKKLADALAGLKLLGSQLLDQLKTRGKSSPQEIADSTQLIEDRIKTLNGRDLRYAKILSDYHQFCEFEGSLLPELIAHENEQKTSAGLNEASNRKTALDEKIAELIEQCPANLEKNAELLQVKEDVASKVSIFSFCARTDEEKSSELRSLKHQIEGGAVPDPERHKAMENYQKRAALLSFELAIRKDYEKFSKNFNDFSALLTQEDSLNVMSIDLLIEMSQDLIAGVANEKIDPAQAISLLEKIEKKHASNPASLDPIRIAIGELFYLSSQKTNLRAMEWYQCCRKLRPSNSLWPRALAIGYLHTLHYSQAESTILEALIADPQNELNQKTAAYIVQDKYQNATLALEWILAALDSLTPREKRADNKLHSHAWILKGIYGALHVASHPSVLKKWLPEALLLSPRLKEELIFALSKDINSNLGWLNTMTLANRSVSAVTGIIESYYTEKTHPTLAKHSRFLARVSNSILFGFSPYIAYLQLRNLKDLSLLSYTLGATSILLPLNRTIPLIQSFLYKDKSAKLASQKANPNLHSVIATLGSIHFAEGLVLFNHLLLSKNVLGRWANRISSRPSSQTVEKIIGAAAVVFIAYRTATVFLQEKKEINTGNPPKQQQVPKSETGFVTTVKSWWNFFGTKLGFSW